MSDEYPVYLTTPPTLTLLLLGMLACAPGALELERERARSLMPARLENAPTASMAGSRRIVRVRVYAEKRYRAQVPLWQQEVRDQLRRATETVEGSLGAVFELESTQLWTLSGDRMDLDSALAELEELDPGEDVDLVVGFLPALSVFSAAHTDLGRARSFGRHCVLHAMENPEVRRSLLSQFEHLPQEERQALYRERKLHQETSILLHEWAHTLGAFHVQDSRWMMHPFYEIGQARFAPQTLQLLAVSLRHMPQARRDVEAQQAWARELRELLTTTTWPAWEGEEKQKALDWTEHVLAGRSPPRAPPGTSLAFGDQQTLREVFTLQQRGQWAEAARALEPLARSYPRSEQVQVLACFLAFRAAPDVPATQQRCEATAASFPTEASALLFLADLRFGAKDVPGARVHLAQAHQRLRERAPEDPSTWAYFAGLLRNASYVTWAEEAAAKAPKAAQMEEILSWATQVRRQTGLAPGTARSGVTPEREGEFIDRGRELWELISRGSLAPARVQVAQLGKDFPGAPGQLVLQCALQLRTGQRGQARTTCRRALEAYEELMHAHFLLGMIALEAGAREEARTHLERTLALDSTNTEVWRMLARLYRTSGQRQALEELQKRYRDRFAHDLP
jgi:predicted Zn-dependent protease